MYMVTDYAHPHSQAPHVLHENPPPLATRDDTRHNPDTALGWPPPLLASHCDAHTTSAAEPHATRG